MKRIAPVSIGAISLVVLTALVAFGQAKSSISGSVTDAMREALWQGMRQRGIQIDLESSHPKMGFLVREAAERAPDVLRAKR